MTTTQKEILAKTAAITKLNMEDKSQENSVTKQIRQVVGRRHGQCHRAPTSLLCGE